MICEKETNDLFMIQDSQAARISSNKEPNQRASELLVFHRIHQCALMRRDG